MSHGVCLRRSWAYCLLFIFSIVSASAHDPFSGVAKAVIHDDGSLDFHMDFNAIHIEGYMAGFIEADNQVSEFNLPVIRDYLAGVAKEFYVISTDGEALPCGEMQIAVDDLQEAVTFDYHCDGPLGESVTFDAQYLVTLNEEYNATLLVIDDRGKQLALGVLDREATVLEVMLPWLVRPPAAQDDAETTTPTETGKTSAATGRKSVSANNTAGQMFGTFLKLGVEHILRGADHLLFLLGLLVVCRNFRATALIITCFTLAHSITLALSTMDKLVINPRLTNICVAATIVYVGVENLIFKGEPKRRWILTFCFGMIHGLGFAQVLRDMGLGSGGLPLVMPLFAFNVGVEVGQLIIAALVLPILWQLYKQKKFEKFGVPAVSVIVTLCGAFWLVQRTFFG